MAGMTPAEYAARREAQVLAQAELRRDRRAQGLCVECETPSSRFYRCLPCRRKHAAALKARRRLFARTA